MRCHLFHQRIRYSGYLIGETVYFVRARPNEWTSWLGVVNQNVELFSNVPGTVV